MARRWAIISVTSVTICGALVGQSLLVPTAEASPSYFQPCSDQDKLAVDPATGTELVCTGKAWDQAPSVPAGTHTTGTRCQSEGIESTSDDGYLIFCSSGVWIHFRE
jgi:hypothetical protein